MTTPGHQAGPTPANGGHTPGKNLPDRDGAPGAENPRYGSGDGSRRYDPSEEAYGPYDSPEDSYSPYAPSGEDPGWYDPAESPEGRSGPPAGEPGRHGTQGVFDDWFRTPQGGARQQGAPGNGQDWQGAAADGGGRQERPPAGDGGYGQDTARMSPPDTRGRPPARHAAGPGGGAGGGAADRGDPGGAANGLEDHRTEVYRTQAYQPDAYQPDAYQPDAYQPDPYQPDPYQGQGRAGRGYPDQGYGGQNPNQGYGGQGYASEADWVEARWSGTDRAQAVPAPPRPAPGPVQAAGAGAGQAAGFGAAQTPGIGQAQTAGAGQAQAASASTAPAAGSGQAASANTSLLRSSSVMAVGTLASRLTGFVRNAVIIFAIGTLALGNAYNLANTLPNIVYNLALGGILTSVVVPLLVNAAKRDADRGEGYDQRIFTLGVLALGGITLLGTALARPISAIYAGNIGSQSAYHLTVIFAYFFIPQIFFYGVSSLAGAILNARGSFAAPMWTPVINNVVVIVVGVAFMATAGLNRTPTDISAAQVQLLGIGTTLGIVLQTLALIPSMRRVGFRWRPRRDFRRAEISEIGHMSGWMFGYVLTTQISFLVTTRIANVGGHGVSAHDVGAGFAAYSNAYTLFQLPYAIVGISVITALLPRMSAHAAERKFGLVSADFSTAVRLASVVVVPAALILAVLGAPLAEAVFGYGSTSVASARYVGEIFAVFSLGLLPFTLFQLLLRVFYAMHDSKTPALISVVTMVINIVANLIALAVLPPRHVVAGLGAGFGLASLAGTIAAWRVLSRRIGSLDGQTVRAGLVKMHAAAIPGAIFAFAVGIMVSAVLSGGRIAAVLTVAIGGSGAMLLYVLFAKSFGVAELSDLTTTLRARLR